MLMSCRLTRCLDASEIGGKVVPIARLWPSVGAGPLTGALELGGECPEGCTPSRQGVADYLSKCARICLHQQRASGSPRA